MTAGGGEQQRRRPLPRSIVAVAASKPHAEDSSRRASQSRLPFPAPDAERRDRGSEASTSSPSLPDAQRWHRGLSELRTAAASVALAVTVVSTFSPVLPPPAAAAATAALSSAPTSSSSSSSRTVPVDRAWLEGLVIEDTRAK